MSQKNAWPESTPPEIVAQPNDTFNLTTLQCDRLIISMRKIDNTWHVLSMFGDDVWWLTGAPRNSAKARSKIDFTAVPLPLRAITKKLIYRYLRSGCKKGKRPGASTTVRSFAEITYFIKYISLIGISRLADLTPLAFSSYLQSVRAQSMRNGKPLSPEALYKRIKAVETIYLLSQYTDDPIAERPWPNMSVHDLAGTGKDSSSNVTPLLPDDVFASLFQAAWNRLQEAPQLLDLRDELVCIEEKKKGRTRQHIANLKGTRLKELGFAGTLQDFKFRVISIRTACYIVVASLSGCRNHELSHVKKNCVHSTEDDEGEQYWWMRSYSQKTFEGNTEWMIPEAAVDALNIMERWALPYQNLLEKEIKSYRAENPEDMRIAVAEEHIGALFIGKDGKRSNIVRTLSLQTLNNNLREFARSFGIVWKLASHQFRRKFANYAARSKFGDLRYLREHFKHWSMDMTLGYAMNESQEMALYMEIQAELDEIKETVVGTWLEDEPLAGGYGRNLVDWRVKTENVIMFKSHSAMVRSIAQSTPIRSNGHAWCTAEDNLCVGNNSERTRCGAGCNNGVIGRKHAFIYQGLYDQLKSLEKADDIGPGGRERVKQDLNRCASVLTQLGYKPEEGAL